MADETFAGPVDCLVFGFPPSASVGEGLQAVLERVDEGAIEILDLECVAVDASGAPVARSLAELQGDTDLDLSIFDGADSNLLDRDDLAAIAESLDPGWFALAIVYEDRSLARASRAWAKAGGRELLSGGVDIEELSRALDRED